MQMKNLKKILLCLTFLMMGICSVNVQASEYFQCSAKVKDYNYSRFDVKLEWEKKNVNIYKIYRSSADGRKRNFQLIASVDAKKTSYTDTLYSKEKYYEYQVIGYTYKKGKYVESYCGSVDVYTGIPPVNVVYEFVDEAYNVTPKKVTFKLHPNAMIHVCESSSVEVDGLQVLKKKNGKYVPIKSVSLNKYKKGCKVVDKQVKPGKKYNYAFRTYKKIGGKTIYSSIKNTELKITTLSDHPKTAVKIVTPYDPFTKEMVISITNKNKYGTFILDGTKEHEFYEFSEDCELDDSDCSQVISAMSKDNTTWKTNVKKIKIEPHKTVYIKIKETSNMEYNYDDLDYISIDGTFCGLFLCIEYNVKTNKTKAYVESYYD